MTEADLNQAAFNWITLAYTTSQWWLALTTALIVATYFAARHIPPWFFAIIMLLYLLESASVVFEVTAYIQRAYIYGLQLDDLRIAAHALGANAEPSAYFKHNNGLLNESIFVIGSFCAIAFSFLHWRHERSVRVDASR